jgi:hypothetical protein
VGVISYILKISTIVYGRYNEMGQLPNYIGAQTAQRENNLRNASVGVLFKHILDFNLFNSKLISGIDADYSPGVYNEWAVTTTKSGDYFLTRTIGALQYDYDVKFYQASPFVQLEASPLTPKLKAAGRRTLRLHGLHLQNQPTPHTGRYDAPARRCVAQLRSPFAQSGRRLRFFLPS